MTTTTKPRAKKPRAKKPTGFVIHRGEINGHPFVVIATMKTRNPKTGPMVQIWFLLERENPVLSVKTGIDALTICRDCPFASGNGCYVNVGNAPLMVWGAYHRGAYPEIVPAQYAQIFGGKKIRFGAYGNPTLLPIAKVKAITEVSAGWTGYFHDWKSNPLAHGYARYFMASTETEDSRRIADSLGFRTFHVSPNKPEEALECLADSKGMDCATCRLCAGLSKSRQPSIWINPHGAKKKRAIAAARDKSPYDSNRD
jgi:hypothetical protein